VTDAGSSQVRTPSRETPPPGAGDKVVRRIRLPADRRTPAAARALVRSVLEASGLNELLDASLLLTTELSTNAVVHAGTDLQLEVIADRRGVTVTVIDDARGVVASASDPAGPAPVGAPVRASLADLSERGRGLLLVDHFATRWGTTHYDHGKGVWFRLNRRGSPEPIDTITELTELAAVGPDDSATLGDPPALNALLEIAQDPYADDPVSEFAQSLLARLADLVGAGGGMVRCDLGEGAGAAVLARYGRPPRPGAPTLRAPLSLGGGASGELELDAPATDYVRPLAALVAERLSLALENDRLRRADRRRQTWLTFLAEASELLAQSLDVELTMALIPQLVVPRLGQWSAVHTTDSWGRLHLEAAAHADEESLSDLHTLLQRTGPDSVQARLPAALGASALVPLPPPTDGFAIPLIARGQLLGTLSVGRHLERRHDPDEIAVLQDVARRAALAVDNARIHAERRNVARTLQRSLLPPALPSVPGLGFGAAYVPTGDTGEVGGDFYDVVPLRDNRWLVAIGDVSGKGVQAATVTGLVREVIRALVRGGRPLPEILERINETLVDRGRGRFCTLALASVRLGGNDRLEVSLHLAGHDQPVLVRADGRTSAAGSGGTALGLLDTVSCPAETVFLAPGDSLIFYTDGVTERRRGRELFGRQRLRDAAGPLASYSAEIIAARLRTATIGFSAEPPRDDIALLVLRNDPVPAPTPPVPATASQAPTPQAPTPQTPTPQTPTPQARAAQAPGLSIKEKSA
jgi:serine phosphatase RsbU (regulator of sigma subunit)/anti-sigma regulatory factor (Ser/Thr protein kinase)